MSNNPLEAVTQAVNSLVTALKLPDESAKANEVLGEMSFPQFSRLLPYRDYNQESGLFMNDTTMGFMLEAIPINGANESIVEALDHMLRTKLPRGIPLCIHLMSSQLVGDRIEYGLREFSWSGEQAERFNAITRAYYMKAAATQFPLPEGMNLPLTLRHYRVFISYCSPSKKKSRADILEMENLVKIIRASLQGASITTQTVDAQAFIDIVGEMINHNPDSLYPKRRQLDPYSDLNYQCVEDSFDLKVRADYLTLGLRENGRNSTARILNFHLARNPEIAFLWNMADNYSNLLNPELSISCPFILTLTLVVEDQVKTHSEANLKYMDLEKKSKTSYAKWFPSVEKEAKEWGELRQRLGSGQSSVVSYFLNITAFCKDNNETALEVEQDILNSFRKNGFELISPRFNHMRNFLTCLPFMAGKGLFKQLKEAGVVQRAESFNVANLMPLVADGGNRTLVKDGQSYSMYQSCWAYRDTYVTQSADKGTCQTYTDNPACTLVSHQCAFYSEEGACLHEYATYSCESKTSGKVMVCGGDVFCLDGECDKAQSGKSNDFAEAVSQLAALAAAGKDVAALNGVDVRAFTGQAKFCKKAAAGYSNCCKDSGWGQDIGLAKCSSDEKALAKAKSNKLTVSVGEFCSKKVLGVCLEKKRSYCQFDSKLAQIVQQQGRNGQLRISFGSAKHPDCRGITVDELQKIQFDRLDFTNFYEDLMNNQKIPDSGVLTQKVKEQIADQLKQAGQ